MSAFLTARRSALFLASSLVLAACGGGGDGGTPVTPMPPVVPPVAFAVTHTVTVKTTKGDIVVGLDATHAPNTVANFLKYTSAGFYSDTVFHRVIPTFVIQGGGFVRNGTALTEKAVLFPPVALESNVGLRNLRGTIAMARTQQPNSATSQFYFNVVDNACLDYGNGCAGADPNGYAVFGKVSAGLDVIDAIKAVATGSGDVPVQDVTISEVKLTP